MTGNLFPTPGEALKASAQALLEARRTALVLKSRRALLMALLTAETATADDVRQVVELPPGVDPKVFGAVPGMLARAGIIRRVGFAQTARAKAHARPVAVWKLADRSAALQWLAMHPEVQTAEGGAA